MIDAVTLFVKDARQKRTRSDKFTSVTEAYYREYNRLGISELRLVELASTIGRLLNEGMGMKLIETEEASVDYFPTRSWLKYWRKLKDES